MEKPCVSVIVPVYNREHLLVRCLDTLVYQTLENIEILVIDDDSTDHSLDIALEYQKQFSEKVKVVRNTKKGVANAKNLGIEHARGEYITFVDSDDYVEYWAYEKMYDQILKTGAEILCAPMYRIDQGRKVIWGKINRKNLVNILFSDIFSLCTKLIRRDIFSRFGKLPELLIGEDSSYIYSVFSYLDNKIAYFEQPYYYYELSDNSISVRNTQIEVIEDILRGNSYILTHCNPEYLNILKCIVIRRTCNMMNRYGEYEDLFVRYLQSNKEIYEQNLYLKEKCPRISWQLNRVLEVSQKQIPHIAYVNGFGKMPEINYVNSLKEKLFREDARVIILNEENCDVKENKLIYQAYLDKRFKFVGDFFVLKHMLISGGFFVSEKIQINTALDALCYNHAIFSFLDDTHFSGDIFGAVQGNMFIAAILETYSMPNLYEDIFEELEHRIRTVLVAKGGIKLFTGERKQVLSEAAVFEPGILLQKIEGKLNFCEERLHSSEEGVVLYRRDTLYCMIRNLCKQEKADQKVSSKENNMVDCLLREKNAILNSTSWRITRPLRILGNLIYRIRKPYRE